MANLKKRKRRAKRTCPGGEGDNEAPRSSDSEQGFDPATSSAVAKYWRQRYSLFSRYDDGILMDEEGWFSVTPEAIAVAQAARAAAKHGAAATIVLDCFAGMGGNAIQFALRGCFVVAIEIDPVKVEFALNNAKIYGVENKIDFIVGDFFELAPLLKGDFLFLSPPWGGPSYAQFKSYTLDLIRPRDGYSMFQLAQQITPNIIMFLPRNIDANQLEELSWLSSPPLNFEIEENRIQSKVKEITAYFGDAVSSPGLSQI